MGVTFLGAVFIAFTLACIVGGRQIWVPWLLSAAMPFMQSTAVTVGDNKVSPFYVAAFTVVYFLGREAFTSSRRRLTVMSGFLSYCALSAMLLPILFEGKRVLVPRGGIDGQVLSPGQLHLSLSNVAQLVYVTLGVAVVHYFAVNRPSNIHFLGVGFSLGTLLNTWALTHNLTGLYYPAELFFPGNDRQTSSFNGIQRLVGIFAEPSYLATFAVAAFAYSAFRSVEVRGVHRSALTVLAALNLLCLVFAFSGTALASCIIVLGLVLAVAVARLALARTTVSPRTLVAAFCATGMVTVAWPTIMGYIKTLAGAKVGSDSYTARGGSNSFSWQIFLDTGGLGAGLGSSRPSSFFFLLLSNIGLVGTALFLGLIVKILRRATRSDGFRPEVWALIAVLTAKVVAEPNMSSPVLWLTLAACASALTTREIRETAHLPATPVGTPSSHGGTGPIPRDRGHR